MHTMLAIDKEQTTQGLGAQCVAQTCSISTNWGLTEHAESQDSI